MRLIYDSEVEDLCITKISVRGIEMWKQARFQFASFSISSLDQLGNLSCHPPHIFPAFFSIYWEFSLLLLENLSEINKQRESSESRIYVGIQ